jgi:hypothetical protein
MREHLTRRHPTERDDGRPSDDDRDDAPRDSWPSSADASDGEDAPTIAPEERGGTPATEHAPGSDL